MKKTILAVLIVVFSNASYSNEQAAFNEFVSGALSMGEFAGRCGIYKRQLAMLQAKKNENAEAVFNNFWNNEAANLGLSTQEYKSKCETVFLKFNEFKNDFRAIK